MSRRIPERPPPDVSDVFKHLQEGELSEGKPSRWPEFWESFVVGAIVGSTVVGLLLAFHHVY